MANSSGPVSDPLMAVFSPSDVSPHATCGTDALTNSLVTSLLENCPTAATVLDSAFDILAANSAARRMLGMEEVRLPAAGAQFLGPMALSRIEALFAGPADVQTASFRVQLSGEDAKGPLHVKATRLKDTVGRTIGVMLSFSGTLWGDSPLPEGCLPERVEALGLYSAGIVHEFNNLLSVISGRAGLGLMAHGPEAKRRALENVITAARRAEHVTKNLLTYVQRRKPDLALVDLRRPVLEAISLLEIEFTSAHVETVRKFDELPAVLCDPIQVTQVCFNLLRNAKDAMSEGGTITASLRKQGNWAVLSVSDNGKGIPPEVQSRLFEPFVSHGRSRSLKPSGTGLGLFIAKEIILAHGGEISVESVVARGSVFTVRLPLSR